MDRKKIVDRLLSDVNLSDDTVVKTVVIQNTIWDNYVECACFTSDAKYSALAYEDDDGMRFETPFVKVPNQEGK